MKKWYTSKVLWVNFIAFIGIAIQMITGRDALPPDQQVLFITFVNFILRMVTKTELQ
jgi:hypothetical protein